jgi:DNA-binding transcriptional ArsR family regulator
MTAFLSRASADILAKELKTYAQPQRLMILSVLNEGEQTVNKIEELTGIGQPALSQQLAELRRAGLVVTRRVARQVHYRLTNDEIERCIHGILIMFGVEKGSNNLSLQPTRERALTGKIPAPLSAASFARIL